MFSLFCFILTDVWSLTILKRPSRPKAPNVFTTSNHVRCCSNQNTYVTILCTLKCPSAAIEGLRISYEPIFCRSTMYSSMPICLAGTKKKQTIISIICRCPEWLYSVPTKLQLMNKRVHSKKNNAMIAGNIARRRHHNGHKCSNKAHPKKNTDEQI